MHNQDHETYVSSYNSKIDAMDREASEWSSDVKREYEESRDAFRKNLDSWQDVAEDKWEDFKAGVDNAWSKVEHGWNHVKESARNGSNHSHN